MAAARASSSSPENTPYAKKMTQFGRFWLTVKGRNVVGVVGAVAAASYFGGYVALHTWLIRNGFMTPLSLDVFERAKSALNDLKLQEKERQSVSFFTVYGMDMFYAGSTKTTGGATIGIPRNYIYKDVEDVEKNDITVEDKFIEWGSEDGELLKNSLVLSENAQKFGIAREIAMADTHYVYLRGVMGTFAIALYQFLTRNANEMLYGLYKPRSFRTVVYAGVSLFCFSTWAVSSDILTKFYENYADKRVGSINLNYAKGGVEFYSKLLQRNIALRSLMGPSGEKLYTFFGNDIEFIRERHVPFTRRKSNLTKLAELCESKENSVDINIPSADPRLLNS